MMRILKKHKVFLIVLLILLLAFGVYRVYSWIQGEPREDLLYTQEYISGTGNIKGAGSISTPGLPSSAFARHYLRNLV